MHDADIAQKLEAQAARLEQIYASVEKTRKYFLASLIVTLAIVVLPLIGLMVIIPQFLGTYSATLEEFEALQ